MAHPLDGYRAASGRFVPVWTLEIQTLPRDVDRILDAVVAVHPLAYGRYDRNASVTAVGKETARPQPGSTTDTHVETFRPGSTETFPAGRLKEGSYVVNSSQGGGSKDTWVLDAETHGKQNAS